MTKITVLEKQVLDALIEGLYAEPGFSDVVAADLVSATGLKKEAVAALIGSLEKKRVIFNDETDVNDENYTFIYIEEAFYHLHSESWDSERVWQNEHRAKAENPEHRTQVEKAAVEFVGEES